MKFFKQLTTLQCAVSTSKIAINNTNSNKIKEKQKKNPSRIGCYQI